jgi:hypothetical protein
MPAAKWQQISQGPWRFRQESGGDAARRRSTLRQARALCPPHGYLESAPRPRGGAPAHARARAASPRPRLPHDWLQLVLFRSGRLYEGRGPRALPAAQGGHNSGTDCDRVRRRLPHRQADAPHEGAPDRGRRQRARQARGCGWSAATARRRTCASARNAPAPTSSAGCRRWRGGPGCAASGESASAPSASKTDRPVRRILATRPSTRPGDRPNESRVTPRSRRLAPRSRPPRGGSPFDLSRTGLG